MIYTVIVYPASAHPFCRRDNVQLTCMTYRCFRICPSFEVAAESTNPESKLEFKNRFFKIKKRRRFLG